MWLKEEEMKMKKKRTNMLERGPKKRKGKSKMKKRQKTLI